MGLTLLFFSHPFPSIIRAQAHLFLSHLTCTPSSTTRPRYEHYTPLIANRTTILKESFNLEVPIRLPPTKPPRPGLDTTKYYRYNRDIHHNTKDCWALKDKVEELIQAGYLAHFVIRPNNHQAGAKPSGHQGEQHGNHDADKRRDKAKEWGR